MTETKPTTPIRAIRAKCLDCCCGIQSEVRNCPTPDCPLYPYRMGHNPNRKGLGGKISNFSTDKDGTTAEAASSEDVDENWHTALDDEKINS